MRTNRPWQARIGRLTRALAVTIVVSLIGGAAVDVERVRAARALSERPDIIVVMVDDLGAIDERILRRLPNISDLWLDGGLRFDAYYGETPLCCPGRATFLSGQHTRRHGVTTNHRSGLEQFNQKKTIAVAFQDTGYHTIFAGKHLNSMTRIDPQPPGWDKVAMLDTWTDLTSSYVVQGEPVPEAGYRDRFSGEKALEWFADAPADRPVFMWLTPHAPHRYNPSGIHWRPSVEPIYATDARCSGVAPWKPPSYRLSAKPDGFPLERICRSLLTVDDIVGKLRDEAQRQGRNPVWVFTSDNGMAWGAHGYPQKRAPWADRAPLYFSGRGVRTGASDALLSSIDLSPTLADLAGASMPWADGKSFADLLADESGGRAWMLQDYPAYPDDNGKVPTWWAIRQPGWRLVNLNGTRLLFRTRVDPWEMKNLAASRPDKVTELQNLYNEISATLPPPPTKPIPVDTTPPSVPTGLAGVAQSRRYVQLTWKASTDNASGTIRYRVFRDGVAIGTKLTGTSYTDRPPTVGTYRYQVRAIDAAGNKSAKSAAISVKAVKVAP